MTPVSSIALENYDQPLSTDEAHQIAITAGHVACNRAITRGYHRLKLEMANLIGAENLSWCAFACWSSNSVGAFIRRDVVPASMRALLNDRDSESFANRVLGQVSAILADANRMVWIDVGPLFARFIETFEAATHHDAVAFERFAANLCPGGVTDIRENSGENRLMAAFQSYHAAMFTTDAKRKAELILKANAQIGYHEQARLQPFIKRALETPISLLMDAGLRRLAHRLGLRRWWTEVDAWLRRQWVGLATRCFMYLELPDASLSLGKDLPGASGSQMFPEVLLDIEDPELRRLLDEIDLTPNTVVGSAARNWADFAERMNFIIDLFRTRQQDTRLYRAPFAQAA